MGVEKELERTTLPLDKSFVVEATDTNGSVVGRDAFATETEAEAHAERLRAQGYKVDRSSLAPKSDET